MTPTIKKIRNSRVAIWGCGKNFLKKKKFILETFQPQMYIDGNSNMWGKEVTDGIICSSPAELTSDKIDIVVITPENGDIINQIKGQLNSNFEVYILNYIWDENEIELQKKVDFGIQDERIKHFSCELGNCACNLNCSYCYVDFQNPSLKHTMQFQHTVPFMLKALSRERLGGRAFFNICGQGETLLKPGIVEFIYGLLSEQHFVGIITNGTVTKIIKELLSFPKEMVERMIFQFSLHYLELIEKNLIDVYFDNVNLVRKAGASVCTTFPGSDEYRLYADEIKKLAMKRNGFLPVVFAIRAEPDFQADFPLDSKNNREKYLEAWKDFKSVSLEFRSKTWNKYTELCYSGINSGWINLTSGELRSCIPGKYVDNIYDNISAKINMLNNPHFCEYGYCSHNAMFLSGVKHNGENLPTWYNVFNQIDEKGNATLSECIKEATNFTCDY